MKMKRTWTLLLSIILVLGMSVAAVIGTVSAADERMDVKVTKHDKSNGFLTIYTDLTGRTGNGTSIENYEEVKPFILFNDQEVNNTENVFDIHMRSNMLWFYTNTGKSVKTGDTIELREGLHFPVVISDSERTTEFKDYLGESYKVRLSSSGDWVQVAAPGTVNTVKSVSAVTETEAGSILPAFLDVSFEFNLEVTYDEQSQLEAQDIFADNIFINGKSVSEINESAVATDNDGQPIPAVSISAFGPAVKISAVKDATLDGKPVFDLEGGLCITFGEDFVSPTGMVLDADVTRYYINKLTFWSTLAPYDMEKSADVTVTEAKDFAIIDGGANGSFDIVFSENISTGTMLAYNFHPGWLHTLPDAYKPTKELGNELASSGATISLLENVIINGKSLGEHWDTVSGPEAKSNLYQFHILGTKTLSIRSASSIFTGNEDMSIELKAGLKFYNGAQLANDVRINYIADAEATVLIIDAESITASADKTTLEVEETAQISYEVTPANATGEVVFISSDTSVITVDGQGLVTALKAGTASVTVKCGDITSQPITFTVNVPQIPTQSVSVDKASVSLKTGDSHNIVASVTPADNTDTLTYSSSDTSIASVDANGKVTALKKGTATITVTSGAESATVTVTVSEPGGISPFLIMVLAAVILLGAVATFVFLRKNKNRSN